MIVPEAGNQEDRRQPIILPKVNVMKGNAGFLSASRHRSERLFKAVRHSQSLLPAGMTTLNIYMSEQQAFILTSGRKNQNRED